MQQENILEHNIVTDRTKANSKQSKANLLEALTWGKQYGLNLIVKRYAYFKTSIFLRMQK
jgi:hypothetical protein